MLWQGVVGQGTLSLTHPSPLSRVDFLLFFLVCSVSKSSEQEWLLRICSKACFEMVVLSRFTDHIFDGNCGAGSSSALRFIEEILPLVEEHLWIQSHNLEANWLEGGGGNPHVRGEEWKVWRGKRVSQQDVIDPSNHVWIRMQRLKWTCAIYSYIPYVILVHGPFLLQPGRSCFFFVIEHWNHFVESD